MCKQEGQRWIETGELGSYKIGVCSNFGAMF